MSHIGNDIYREQKYEALLEEGIPLSICCGAEANEYIENFCNACNEATSFEESE